MSGAVLPGLVPKDFRVTSSEMGNGGTRLQKHARQGWDPRAAIPRLSLLKARSANSSPPHTTPQFLA